MSLIQFKKVISMNVTIGLGQGDRVCSFGIAAGTSPAYRHPMFGIPDGVTGLEWGADTAISQDKEILRNAVASTRGFTV
jgi:hypothetical protein